jgi:hypothetical protein
VLDHYKNLYKTKYEQNLDEFVAGEFPKLYAGVGHEALHPLIHLGYGYAVRSPVLVIEGMAFLHFGFYRMNLDSYSAENIGMTWLTLPLSSFRCQQRQWDSKPRSWDDEASVLPQC